MVVSRRLLLFPAIAPLLGAAARAAGRTTPSSASRSRPRRTPPGSRPHCFVHGHFEGTDFLVRSRWNLLKKAS